MVTSVNSIVKSFEMKLIPVGSVIEFPEASDDSQLPKLVGVEPPEFSKRSVASYWYLYWSMLFGKNFRHLSTVTGDLATISELPVGPSHPVTPEFSNLLLFLSFSMSCLKYSAGVVISELKSLIRELPWLIPPLPSS